MALSAEGSIHPVMNLDPDFTPKTILRNFDQGQPAIRTVPDRPPGPQFLML
jgi:hypothetical protein